MKKNQTNKDGLPHGYWEFYYYYVQHNKTLIKEFNI